MSTTTAATKQIVVPHAKGLCTLLFVHYPAGLVAAPCAAASSLQTATRTLKPHGGKYGDNIMIEHVVTACNVVKGFWEVSQQTHTAAVGFVLSSTASASGIIPRIIFGAHLSFKGATHPDHSGQRMRSAQLNLVRVRAREMLVAECELNTSSQLCAVFGDLNIRPISPFGDCPEAKMHPVVQLDLDDLAFEAWESTAAWVSSPFNLSRPPPLHPPTYPICPETFAAIFQSPPERKRMALSSPGGLLQFFLEAVSDDRESCSAGAGGDEAAAGGRVGQEDGIYAAAGALYDTARKYRFTPASWCDGELSFFVTTAAAK
jgi:hypothetical protein